MGDLVFYPTDPKALITSVTLPIVPNMVEVCPLGDAPHIDEVYSLVTFCSFRTPTDQTTEPILVVDGSNDVVSAKKVPFEGLIDPKIILGVLIPQKNFIGSYERFQPNQKTGITL